MFETEIFGHCLVRTLKWGAMARLCFVKEFMFCEIDFDKNYF